MKKVIHTENAPKAIGPYSQAVLASGPFLFCSGQISLDPKSNQLVEGGVAVQTERVMQNILAVLKSEGLDFKNVVKTTIFLVDMNDFATVNEIYTKHCVEPFPARSTIAVKALPKGVSVEIEVI
ncbi:MAG: RidA family protein, partial [Bdellovibrionales bacterium]|nr:RidA family protein [Bdellovibrionales bacterium]